MFTPIEPLSVDDSDDTLLDEPSDALAEILSEADQAEQPAAPQPAAEPVPRRLYWLD